MLWILNFIFLLIEAKSNESILSLLVKILHKKNNNNAKLLADFDENINESRIGDGSYFIINLLKRAAKINNELRKVIKNVFVEINKDNLIGLPSKAADISMYAIKLIRF